MGLSKYGFLFFGAVLVLAVGFGLIRSNIGIQEIHAAIVMLIAVVCLGFAAVLYAIENKGS